MLVRYHHPVISLVDIQGGVFVLNPSHNILWIKGKR
jgi:hypothetical protein